MTVITVNTDELRNLLGRWKLEVDAHIDQARQRVVRAENLIPHDYGRLGNVENEFRQRIQETAALFPSRQSQLTGAENRLWTAIQCFESVDQMSLEKWMALGSLYGDNPADGHLTLLITREEADVALADYLLYGSLMVLGPEGGSGLWALRRNDPTTASEPLILFLAQKEGFVPQMYNDAAGHCTIGYGHLVHSGSIDGRSTETPFENGLSKPEARELLRKDVAIAENVVQENVRVPLTQNQFDALVDFAYNVGKYHFQKSDLLTRLNKGEYGAVPDELRRWVHAEIKGEMVELPGLVTRRNEEAAIFTNAKYPEYLD
jgi:GH24 family phage-related lysozyme (muramidase)